MTTRLEVTDIAGIVRVTCDNGHDGNLLVEDSEGTQQQQIQRAVANATCKQCGTPVHQRAMAD